MESIHKPLEVIALDSKMNRCTGVIPYRSLRWVRRYCEPGEFEMVIPAGMYDPSWAYIYTDDRPEMGIIQKVQFTDDVHVYGGADSITLSGFFLESILNNIVFLEESPEQEKVYVPEPKQPVYSASAKIDVYTDSSGNYYYRNASGEVVSADTGQTVSEEGLTSVNYTSHGASFNYYSAEDGKITTVTFYGQPEEHDIEFTDSMGNVYYIEDTGQLYQAYGVVSNAESTYFSKKRAWDALDSDEYGHYYEVTVKGPWQRTEALEPVTEGDSVQIVMQWARRMMGDWIRYVEPDIEGVQKSVDPSFQYLGDLLYSTLYEVGASLRLEYEFSSNTYFLSLYRGADRTQAQSGNPWAVFSDTWGTLTNYSASRDESNYRNTCYTMYEYDKPDSFDDDGWPKAGFMHAADSWAENPTLYGISYTSNRGYKTDKVGDDDEPARETYLDLRNEKPTCDSDWSRDIVEIPAESGSERQEAIASAQKKFAKPDDAYDMRAVYEAYEADLTTRGARYLKENYGVETTVDTGDVDTIAYLKDYDLGDKVDMMIGLLGVYSEARITEIEEDYEESGNSISVTIGDQTFTAATKTRRSVK